MKKFLTTFLAGLYLTTQIALANFIAPVGLLGGVVVDDTTSITFIGCTEDTTDQTTYTFSNVNTGTASSTRSTIVAIGAEDAAGVFTVDSVTIEGDSATESVDGAGVGAPTSAAIYVMDNPAGTSEDIVVTFSEAITSAYICVSQANNINITATDTATDNDANAGAMTLSVNTTALGVGVGICASQSAGGESGEWTGFTERFDTAGTEFLTTFADFTEDASASTPLAVTCDHGPSGTADISGASAFYQPG